MNLGELTEKYQFANRFFSSLQRSPTVSVNGSAATEDLKVLQEMK